MTESHPTPEQSPEIEGSRPYSGFLAGLFPELIGLGKRLAAAEQRISELEAKRPAAADHAPAGSLVEQVRTAILNHGDGGEYYDEARAAIRAVANEIGRAHV